MLLLSVYVQGIICCIFSWCNKQKLHSITANIQTCMWHHRLLRDTYGKTAKLDLHLFWCPAEVEKDAIEAERAVMYEDFIWFENCIVLWMIDCFVVFGRCYNVTTLASCCWQSIVLWLIVVYIGFLLLVYQENTYKTFSTFHYDPIFLLSEKSNAHTMKFYRWSIMLLICR